MSNLVYVRLLRCIRGALWRTCSGAAKRVTLFHARELVVLDKRKLFRDPRARLLDDPLRGPLLYIGRFTRSISITSAKSER